MCTVAVTPWHAQTAPCVTTIGMSAFLGIGFMAGWGRTSAAASDPGSSLATFSACCLRLSLRAFSRFAAATALTAPLPGTNRGCLLREPTLSVMSYWG